MKREQKGLAYRGVSLTGLSATPSVDAARQPLIESSRIANVDRLGTTGGKHSAYENWTREQLYEKARQVGIDGRSKMTKAQLKRALRSG